MSRSSAAFDYAPTSANDSSAEDRFTSTEPPTWAEDKNPTRPLPVFRLEEEARRLDQAAEKAAALAAVRCDDDATVTVSPEDNERLLASLFPGAASEKMPSPLGEGDLRCSDDEPTLDAPAPASPEALAWLSAARPVRVTARPAALKMLVITKPAPPPHTPRASTGPDAASPIALAPIALAPVALALVAGPPESGFRPRIAPSFAPRLPKRDTTTYVVAGIWAMAISLIALLMFMATSA